MQDWDRTMESVEYAQDAAGASAYQYSKMADGLEASITNLTTSWQSFTASLINSDFVIGILDGITEVVNALSQMSDFWKFIMIGAAAVVGYTKLQETIDTRRLKQHLEMVNLKKQAGEQEALTGQLLKEQIIQEKAKLEIMKRQLAVQEEQKLLELEKKTHNSLDDADWIAYYEQETLVGELRNGNYSSYGDIGKQQQVVSDLEGKNKSILATKIAQLKTDISLFKTGNANLTTEQATELTSGKTLASKIRLLFITKKQIANNTKIGEQEKENLLQAKKMEITSLKKAGLVAAIAAAVVLTYKMVKGIVELTHKTDKALESIQERSNTIYETTQKRNNLSDLVDQYEELYNSVYRTKEQEEEMLELEHQLQAEEGVSGTGKALIASGRAAESAYQAKITEEQLGQIADTLYAFRDDMNNGEFFDNGTFESAMKDRYSSKANEKIETELKKLNLNLEDLNEQLTYARKVSGGLMEELDTSAVAKQAIKNQSAQNNLGAEIFDAGAAFSVAGLAGSALGGLAAGAGVGAIFGGGVFSVPAAVVGAVIGGLVSSGVAVVESIKQSSQKNANEAALEYERLMAEQTAQITNFSVNMSKVMDESLAKKYEVIKDALNNSNYSEHTKDAIENMYSSVIAVFEDPQIASTVEKIGQLLGNTAQGFLEDLELALAGFNTDLLGQANNIVLSALQSGKTKEQGVADLYVAMANKNGSFYQEGLANFEADKQAQIDAKQAILDSKKKMKAQAAIADTTWQAIQAQYTEELEEIKNQTYENSEQFAELQDSILSMVSAYDSVLSLQQGLTGLDSAKESVIEIDKALNDGTLSLEQMTTLASTLGDEFYEALNNGGLDAVRELITEELINPYDDYLTALDNYIIREQALIDAEEDKNSAVAKSHQQNIDLLTEYRKEYMTFNKVSLASYMNEKRYTALEKESNAGSIKATKTLVALKKQEYNTQRKRLESYFKNNPKEMALIEGIRAGVISVEDAWAEVADKETFKMLLNNTESYFDDLEELQQEVLDNYKKVLEAEKDALKNSLDRRKDLYEEYFDAIDAEAEEDDFQSDQMRLQNAIAALSTATDANSLEKLKEYQSELAKLQADHLSDLRDSQRDNMTTLLENQSESLEQYYEERLNNEKALWDEISSYSEQKIDDIASTLVDQLNSIQVNSNGTFSLGKPYATGGIVDYTGLAMVHGSSNKPEAFLNANQTAMFTNLAKNLEHYYSNSRVGGNELSKQEAVNIDAINVNVNGVLNADNVQQTANDLATAIKDSLRRTGLSLNTR